MFQLDICSIVDRTALVQKSKSKGNAFERMQSYATM